MSGLRGIFKSKNTNSSVANALAKDYQKKATKLFKQYLTDFPDAARPYTGFAVRINSISFSSKTVDIDPKIENIFGTKYKTTEELYDKEKFIHPEALVKDKYWFLSRDFDEIQDFLRVLESLNYTLMWELDKDTNNYVLYPIFFVN